MGSFRPVDSLSFYRAQTWLPRSAPLLLVKSNRVVIAILNTWLNQVGHWCRAKMSPGKLRWTSKRVFGPCQIHLKPHQPSKNDYEKKLQIKYLAGSVQCGHAAGHEPRARGSHPGKSKWTSKRVCGPSEFIRGLINLQ